VLPAAQAKAAFVQSMFGRIADRYDLMNRLMTLDQDRRWRRQVAVCVKLPSRGKVLDIGTGTGGIARSLRRCHPTATVVAADFTAEMMHVGHRRHPDLWIDWCGADALDMPFADQAFDGVVCGYLLRNVSDLSGALSEQYRVLKPGGRLVCLDTCPPPAGWLRPLIRLHFEVVIPLLGQLVAGDRSAYTYLPTSTEAFRTPTAMTALIRSAGFTRVAFRTFMFGTMAMYFGVRPD